ncbi:hypothetical protein GHT06_019563 [Daphnia sinensis]|uniref:Fucosyltransferase n=1 Tax=Daphnia sinensis TaxID=1820382 RepID=A0AAD5L1J2_9CRUS|nr:hypothetical protein GHT06_019563 [Daphnia sinensis]
MFKQRRILPAFLLGVLISTLLYLHAAYFAYVEHSGLLQKVSKTKELRNGSGKWKRISVTERTKNILLWNDVWGYRFGIGRAAFIDAGCRVSNCFITRNSNYVPHEDFDAIIINPSTQKTPYNFAKRKSNQRFVMYTNEPPAHMPQNMNEFDNYFNWTITYRADSTFPYKYGEIVPLESAPSTVEEAMAMRQDMMRSGINPAKGKTKLAVWMVSNCNAESNRQTYVKILKKYAKIDIFSQKGQCGGQDKCPKRQNRDGCYQLVEKTYKFYLAFENSICKDYVTEKFFESINRNIIPVVLGGADYAAIAPPHSYINALDYTPRQLAEYLKELDRNDTLYAEYFWWKPHYRASNLYGTCRNALCDLCEALHSTPFEKSTVKSVQSWYMEPSLCRHFPTFKDN